MMLEITTAGSCRPFGFRLPFPARRLVWHGRNGPIAIDAGYGARPTRAIWAERIYAASFRVRYAEALPHCAKILITHHHLDHIGGLEDQSCTGPIPPSHRSGFAQLRHATFARCLSHEQTLLPNWTHERFGFPAVKWEDIEVLALPGHTANQIGVYLPPLHLLYVADAVWFLDWLKHPSPPRWAVRLQEQPREFLATFQRLRAAIAASPTLRLRCAHDPGQPFEETLSV